MYEPFNHETENMDINALKDNVVFDNIHSSFQHTRSFYKKFVDFLNSKTGSILTQAMGMAIGMAFKDAITAIVNSFIKPLIVFIIVSTQLTKFYDFTYFFESQDNAMNVTVLVQSIITFAIVVMVVYYVSNLINYNADIQVSEDDGAIMDAE
jgi:large-conductance mechanosensitive channel